MYLFIPSLEKTLHSKFPFFTGQHSDFPPGKMATHVNTTFPRATLSSTMPFPSSFKFQSPLSNFVQESPRFRIFKSSRIHVSNGGDSYLHMWRKAIEREKKSKEFERIAGKLNRESSDEVGLGEEEEEEEGETVVSQEELEKKSNEFKKILEVNNEERDRIQRMQVVDRAEAAITAAKEILEEDLLQKKGDLNGTGTRLEEQQQRGSHETGGNTAGTPGPSFWSWIPPSDDGNSSNGTVLMKPSKDPAQLPVIEKERTVDALQIPFESAFLKTKNLLPPVQQLPAEEELEATSSTTQETHNLEEELEFGVAFSTHAAEAAEALHNVVDDASSLQGVNPDGARWWKETGVEQRPDGVICKWTVTRGVSADKAIEWEEKYWEAADELGYKELGSEKSGRDAAGNLWREYWRESMMQNGGLAQLEKTADKWGKNAKGEEWQEQWWEQYGAAGQAEKWAHKWCSIDPNTPLDAGHAHVWHERWGEKYDGKGGSTKYTDKWAERCEDGGGGWSKWGDKWDENFDLDGHGVKQGETWWEGKEGERWNRTWGEGHNGSGWVHKYGKSSSGEHWDNHQKQVTWYERFPHYGFYHCFDNSVKLREVKRPSEWGLDPK